MAAFKTTLNIGNGLIISTRTSEPLVPKAYAGSGTSESTFYADTVLISMPKAHGDGNYSWNRFLVNAVTYKYFPWILFHGANYL